MKIKSLTIEKMDESGTALARIAQLSAVDSDGDTYAPGAFSWKDGGGQWCSILPAHNRRAMPLGKAWIYEDGDWALAKLHFNLDTPDGKAWHSTLKFDLANGKPVQEYSYGYQILDADQQQRAGQYVQVLKRLDVDEVSPVIRGAGVGTGTLSVKSLELKDAKFASVIGDLHELEQALRDDPSRLSATGLKQLAEIYSALGKAMAPSAGDRAKADLLTAQALGGYLANLSRGNISRRT